MTWGKLRRVGDAVTPILLGGVGLWLIVTALLDSARHRDEGISPPTVATFDTTSVRRAPLPSPRKLLTRPIESIRVGDRVLARNPDVTDDARRQKAEPDWRECSVARLELPLDREPAGKDHEPAEKNHKPNRQTRGFPPTGDPDDRPVLHIELLRPDAWFRQRLSLLAVEYAGPSQAIPSRDLPSRPPAPNEPAPPSATPLRPLYREIAATSASIERRSQGVAALVIDLDLPELGAAGTAIVTELIPASPSEPGPGRIVTGTFAHPPAAQVLDVLLEGEPEPIGVTANHLFWSESDARFVPIGEIAVGQTVRTVSGETKRIVSMLPRPGPAHVYNLEVDREHVYFVGDQGLLVHNSYVGDLGEKAARGWLKRQGYTGVTPIQNRSGHGIDIAARHRDGTLTFFEVKTSVTGRAPRLSRAQRNPERFVRTRLERAALGGPWWVGTDRHVQAAAKHLLAEIDNGFSYQHLQIAITNATNKNVTTNFRIRTWSK